MSGKFGNLLKQIFETIHYFEFLFYDILYKLLLDELLLAESQFDYD